MNKRLELIIVALENDFKFEYDDEVTISEKRFKEEKALEESFNKNKYKPLLEIVLNRNNNLFSLSITFYINVAKIYVKELSKLLDNQNINKVDIKLKENIKRINSAMAQEGIPLTKEIKENIRKCLIGESTTEIECQKVIEKYKIIYEKNN